MTPGTLKKMSRHGYTTRVHPDAASIRLVQKIAHLLDSQFSIPGTKIRFGLDPVFSLFPVLGDLLTYLVSGALIYTMYNQGASRKVVIKMVLNSTFDAVLGTIPVVGTVFDLFYRANDRNVRLLQEHYYEGKHQGSGNGMLIAIVVLAVAVVAAAIFGMWKLLEALF
ncbi:MAG TPA: DUF4112 domain-containing protein [Chryseosolibacter sp.]|nr:DUF4112 domain-containing protein [Chryseosolibacter sp.]